MYLLWHIQLPRPQATTADHHHIVQVSRVQMQYLSHHKLQLATTTTCASGMVAPVERRETPQVQGAKFSIQGSRVKASISTSWCRMQQLCNYNHYHQPDMTHTAWCSPQCNLHEGPPFSSQTWPSHKLHWLMHHALTQVAKGFHCLLKVNIYMLTDVQHWGHL